MVNGKPRYPFCAKQRTEFHHLQIEQGQHSVGVEGLAVTVQDVHAKRMKRRAKHLQTLPPQHFAIMPIIRDNADGVSFFDEPRTK